MKLEYCDAEYLTILDADELIDNFEQLASDEKLNFKS